MEQKIIRIYPSPIKEVSEEETIFVDQPTENAAARTYSVAAAAEPAGTKVINYPAATINDKLGRVNSYATANFTSDSYVPAVLFATASTGHSKINATYIIVPYGAYSHGEAGYTPAIINIALWTRDGRVETRNMKCITGKIDTSSFEVLICSNAQVGNRHAVFIKSNGFRGVIHVRELSTDLFNTSVYLYTNSTESASLANWVAYRFSYANVASEVVGFTPPWVMNINQLPTGNADLFSSFFRYDIGFEGTMAFFSIVQSGQPVSIVLNFGSSSGGLTSITTNTEVKYRQDAEEVDFDLSFVFKGQSYRIKFTIWDDGTPAPGSESVSIKTI